MTGAIMNTIEPDPHDIPYTVPLEDLSQVARIEMYPPEHYDGAMGLLNEFVEVDVTGEPTDESVPQRRRRRGRWVIFGVVGLMVGTGLLWLLIEVTQVL